MNVGITGLGLIGGSVARAISRNTEHRVFGFDISEQVLLKARLVDAIHDTLDDEKLKTCDLVIVALYPRDTVEYIRKNAGLFKKGAIVMDCGGIKRLVANQVFEIAEEHGFVFLGAHPMAGLEFSGFEHSTRSLFKNASMILTPMPKTDIETLNTVKKLCISIGFTDIRVTTPEEHDRLIAFTSQLAHVVSSAYIKSPRAARHRGFSAGSYRDMTRVALLNEKMWAELFIENRDNLLNEIDVLIGHLREYRDALAERDEEKLTELLKQGRERKAKIDKTPE